MTQMRYILMAQYFLWFAALTGILPYVSIFAKNHSDASATQIGLLYTVLPFVAMFTKPMFCGVADRFSCHKLTLVASMTATLFGFGMLVFAPWFQAGTWSFWFICGCVLIANTAMGTVITMNDSMAMREVATGRSTYGALRVFGALGWGLFGLVAGLLNENGLLKSYLPYLLPGLIMFIVIMSINIIIFIWAYEDSADIHDKKVKQLSISTKDDVKNGSSAERTDSSKEFVHRVITLFAKYPSLLYYSFIVFAVGFLTSFHWSFFLWFIEEIAGQDTLLMGLCAVVQSFLGEVPFFLLSHRIVKALGHNNALTVSLGSIAARFLAYGYAIDRSSSYYVLIIELIQGPAYGLFYVVMTAIAQDFSMKCSESIAKNRNTNHVASSSTAGDQCSSHETHNLDRVAPSNGQSAHNRPQIVTLSSSQTLDGDAASHVDGGQGKDVHFDDKQSHSIMSNNSLKWCSGKTDGATVNDSVNGQVCGDRDTSSERLNDSDLHDQTYATMQGFFSGLFEGAGLGVGALVAGLLIDKMGATRFWRVGGYTSLILCIGNFLVNLNLEKCPN